MTWSLSASLVGAAQRLDACWRWEGFLGGAEALADHVHVIVAEHVLFGGHDLREAVHALGLRDRRLDQQDVRARRDRVGPLHVQRGLAGPADHVGVGRVVGGHPPRGLDDLEPGRGGQAVGLVEDGQVVPDGRGAVRVDDDDRGAPAGHPRGVQRGQVVRLPDLGRPVAGHLVGLLAPGRGERAGVGIAGLAGADRARPDDHPGQGGRTGRRGVWPGWGRRLGSGRDHHRRTRHDQTKRADRGHRQPRHPHESLPSADRTVLNT